MKTNTHRHCESRTPISSLRVRHCAIRTRTKAIHPLDRHSTTCFAMTNPVIARFVRRLADRTKAISQHSSLRGVLDVAISYSNVWRGLLRRFAPRNDKNPVIPDLIRDLYKSVPNLYRFRLGGRNDNRFPSGLASLKLWRSGSGMTIIFLLLLFLFPHQIHAANYGMSISPPLLRIHIMPGKAVSQVFKIENLGTTDKTLVARIVPFTEADYEGNPILNPKANAPWLAYFSLINSKIKLEEPFSLAAGASEQLVLSLAVPFTAPLKDLYATLTVSTYENSLDQTFQGTSLRATIGANILITISSQAFPDTILQIEDFLPEPGTYLQIGSLFFVDSLTPLKFSAIVNNQGSFLAETRGVFRITGNNKPVYLEGILPVNVIGKSRRTLVNILGQPFEFTPSLGRIGFHQASLEIKTDNANVISTINLFFFPLKLGLGIILSLFILIIVIKISTKPP